MSRLEKDPRRVSLHDLVMRLMQDAANPNLVHLGAAVPNSEYLPVERLMRLLNPAARRHRTQAPQNLAPPGLDMLRIQIALRAIHAGCNLSPSDIVITSGGNEPLIRTCKPSAGLGISSPSSRRPISVPCS
jgi:DNA-binding transcriptional MocR family regulator